MINKMHWKLFIAGIGFLTAAYLMYRWIKGKRPFSDTNSKGPVMSVYIQYWFGLILCAIGGIALFIESFF